MVKIKYIKLYAHNTHGIFLDRFEVYQDNKLIKKPGIVSVSHIILFYDGSFTTYFDILKTHNLIADVLGKFPDVHILFGFTDEISLDTPIQIKIYVSHVPDSVLKQYPDARNMLYGYRIALLDKDMKVVDEKEITTVDSVYVIKFE